MTWLQVVAMIVALVSFALHAGNVQPTVRPNLLGLGLTFLTLGLILSGVAGPVPR
jgi:uncharacterized membrane protein YvlD (DUF360 family)